MTHHARGITSLWIALFVFGFGMLFPDLATANMPVNAKLFRLMCALVVAAAGIILSTYYFSFKGA